MIIIVDIVCPVYNNYNQVVGLFNSFKEQKNISINNIVFPLTDAENDETKKIESFLKEKNIKYWKLKKNEFSHSLTREKAIRDYCKSKIVVLMSQDIKLLNENSIYNLVKDIESGETVYNYGRQICSNYSLERYIRKKNYPKESYIVEKKDIESMQLMTFFASDAFSALNRDVFLEVGGYNNYDVMMNEDQLYSYIILNKGYKKKYCADAIVVHSHKYTIKQLYKRYYETGVFYKNIKLFDNYKSTNTGLKLAIYVFFQALFHLNIPALIRWLPDMAARYLGMKKGKSD